MAAAAAVAASLAAGAAAAEPSTTISVSAVIASNSTARRSFDSRLEDLRDELKPLRFKSYRLVSRESRTLRGNGDQCDIELPGGRYLNITTREQTRQHLRMHILLNEDNHPVINTDVKIEPDSVVLIGGPHDEHGTLIITIGTKMLADAPKAAARRDASAQASAPTAACRPSAPLTPVPMKRPLPSVVPAPSLSTLAPAPAPAPASGD